LKNKIKVGSNKIKAGSNKIVHHKKVEASQKKGSSTACHGTGAYYVFEAGLENSQHSSCSRNSLKRQAIAVAHWPETLIRTVMSLLLEGAVWRKRDGVRSTFGSFVDTAAPSDRPEVVW
jgi:hypothetical protein